MPKNHLQNIKEFRHNLFMSSCLFTDIYLHTIMQIESEGNDSNGQSPQQKKTLGSIIDDIQFPKKQKVKSTMSISETDSVSSANSYETKEKSKVWTQEEIELFRLLLKKYGTDFHILSAFFPKKTKNQLKNRYKQHINRQKKQQREESNKLKALSFLFKQVDEKQEHQEKDEKEENSNAFEQMLEQN